MHYIAVCDDDETVRGQITAALDSHPRRREFAVEVFSQGEELLAQLRAGNSFLLLILDIQLESASGVEVGRIVRETMRDSATQLLYISAHDSYAMELFDLRPLNFLLKPLDGEKLRACITMALERAPYADAVLRYADGKQFGCVPLREICYLESYNRRVTIHTTHGDLACSQRLAELMRQLPASDFFQIHQAYVVNDHCVRRVRYDRLTLDGGVELSISQNYRKAVRQRLLRQLHRGEMN